VAEPYDKSKRQGETVELATCYVGDALCGLDILNVQEINKHMEVTRVPQSHDCVRGILNLRGQIVTIIDLGQRLGLPSSDLNKESRNIIVNSKGEYIGLNVDKLSDVVQAEWETVESPPANIGGVQGKFFQGVHKTDKELIGILDIEEVLREEEY
jgi:purine-binding chemotaxis protein CheW